MTCITILIAAALLILSTIGCGGSKSTATKAQWLRTEIYCGRGIPAGGQVSEQQFADFLDKVVTKEFPKGMTVFDAYGQMEKTSGTIVKQPTKVILVVHEKSGENSAKVQKVAEEYRSKFGNPQVMHISSPTEPVFYPD